LKTQSLDAPLLVREGSGTRFSHLFQDHNRDLAGGRRCAGPIFSAIPSSISASKGTKAEASGQ
jgi:hypothetical protein